VGDGITPGEESIEDAVARLNRESAAAQERARADRAAREQRGQAGVDSRNAARSADEARQRREARQAEVARQQQQPGRAPVTPAPAPAPAPAPRPASPRPAGPAATAPKTGSAVPGIPGSSTGSPYQAAYGALTGALAKQGWTGSGVRSSAGSPGSDAVLLPSYAVQLAWGRVIGGAVATFIGFQISRWIVGEPFGLFFVLPGVIWLVSGILRVRGSGRERAWGDHGGLHLVDAKGERVIPWRELASVDVVQRGSNDKRRGRIVLTLADGTKLTPRLWDGAGIGPVRAVADRIYAARAGFTRQR
jgi:hypothetical protein